VYLTEEDFLIHGLPEVQDCVNILERYVIQGDLDGFREALILYNKLIQDLTLSFHQ
jgi:hypothetical protein